MDIDFTSLEFWDIFNVVSVATAVVSFWIVLVALIVLLCFVMYDTYMDSD